MLKIGEKEFRNLEEQVQKNLEDIQTLKTGIKIEKSITLAQLPTYTVESRLGQYFLVTDDGTKYLYLITLNNLDVVIAENLGEFPARGPQGIQGVQGEKGDPGESIRGPQGIQGVQGVRGRPGEGWDALDEIDATPYTPTFTEQDNDVEVETSADIITNYDTPDEESKVIDLKFKVPKTDLSDYQKKIVWTKTQYTLEETVNSIEYNVLNPKARIVYILFNGTISQQSIGTDLQHDNVHLTSTIASSVLPSGNSNNFWYTADCRKLVRETCRAGRYVSTWGNVLATGNEPDRNVTNLQKITLTFSGDGLGVGVKITIYEGVE